MLRMRNEKAISQNTIGCLVHSRAKEPETLSAVASKTRNSSPIIGEVPRTRRFCNSAERVVNVRDESQADAQRMVTSLLEITSSTIT